MIDAQEYFLEIVEPTIKEFEANPRCRRRGFLACVAIFHTIDYLAYPKPKRSRTFREEFGDLSPDFAMIDRLAHAFKHAISGHQGSPDKPPLDAKQIIDRPPGTFGEMSFGLSRFGDPTGGLTLAGQTDVDILETVHGAAGFLRERLQLAGQE